MLTFNELGVTPDLIQGIEEIGFIKPTAIQEKIIPIVYESEKDLIGLAQTGTGKTAAFGLPLAGKIDVGNKNARVLILAPTRELCIQISKDLQNYTKYKKGLQVVPVYGGANIDTQIKALKKGAHIITATPGRMLDLLRRKAAIVNKVSTVVLDEADEMLNMGFRDDLEEILKNVPAERRTLLFSATMSGEVAHIAKKYLNDPVRITIGKQNSGAENISHYYYHVHARDRYPVLKRIADIHPDIYGIVFCRTRRETKEVADKLIKDGYNADALHGDLSQSQRDQVMKRFRNKSLQLLVATDVAARGIDVNDISHIINYSLPDDLDIYTHRSGRTGRADKSGVSIAIVNYREKGKIKQIEKIIGKKCEKLQVPTGEEICKKQLFRLIDRMENVEVDEAQISPFMDIVNKKLEWLSKEQIIKHFVSTEFNRFLDYYKNAPDLNENVENKPERQDSKYGKRSKNKRNGANSYTRYFINIGKKDGIDPPKIIGMINDRTNNRQMKIGEIDIKNNFSFFEVEEAFTDKILNSFRNNRFKDRNVVVEIASEKERSRKKKRQRMVKA